jgi:hypothetical protein
MKIIDPDDRDGQPCTKCGVGYYDETSIHDDWDGVLHCINKKCNHEVRRYKSMDNFEPEPDRVVKLSPAAQTVLDAFLNRSLTSRQWYGDMGPQLKLAAALRAVVLKCEYSDDYGTSFINPDDILAIATELEGA